MPSVIGALYNIARTEDPERPPRDFSRDATEGWTISPRASERESEEEEGRVAASAAVYFGRVN